MRRGEDFLRTTIQPALLGLIDGSLGSIAPVFAVALVTHHSYAAFIAGLAAALGPAVSMGFSEALSDDGVLTGRGAPLWRGFVVGAGTFCGAIFHTLPFLIPHFTAAFIAASLVVVAEIIVIALLRAAYFPTVGLWSSLGYMAVAGAAVLGVGLVLGVS